ncbi:prohibitin [Phyllostomus discolor]|uniref:Prohibitin n=1 Tax=Phyllostomus discolor TaxID=89673 RepID=A0A833ZS11_9CHIR|nr:prohibitin [Phyllostomus discolor]
MAAKVFESIGKFGLALAVAGGVVNSALYNVDAGHRAVIFDRFRGVQDIVVGEGTHFLIPWVQKPIIFDCRSRPRNVPVITGSKDLQNVNITLRILFRPVASQLPRIFTSIGEDYDERVLPSITTEILKSVVVSGQGRGLEQCAPLPRPPPIARRQEELGIAGVGGVGKWLGASWVPSCLLFLLTGASPLPSEPGSLRCWRTHHPERAGLQTGERRPHRASCNLRAHPG